jgi:hypothetical protein|tara:strand:- start:677 stop:904 length:228 start_codon:yes stop_codon:yes gene_type:complete
MPLIKKATKLSKENKSYTMCIRMTPAMTKLVKHWTKVTGARSRGDFIRNLVKSASQEMKTDRFVELLKRVNEHEF